VRSYSPQPGRRPAIQSRHANAVQGNGDATRWSVTSEELRDALAEETRFFAALLLALKSR